MVTRGTSYQGVFTQLTALGAPKGKAKTLLWVLEQRGLEVSPLIRARVLECRDHRQLNHWIGRQLTITHPEELFE